MNNIIEQLNIIFTNKEIRLSNFSRSTEKERKLWIYLNSNTEIVQLSFFKIALFRKYYGNIFLCIKEENPDNLLFQKTMNEIYEEIPEIIPYKHYQFLNKQNVVIMEVICKQLDFQIEKEKTIL